MRLLRHSFHLQKTMVLKRNCDTSQSSYWCLKWSQKKCRNLALNTFCLETWILKGNNREKGNMKRSVQRIIVKCAESLSHSFFFAHLQKKTKKVLKLTTCSVFSVVWMLNKKELFSKFYFEQSFFTLIIVKNICFVEWITMFILNE